MVQITRDWASLKIKERRGAEKKVSQSYTSTVFAQTHAIETVQRMKRTATDLLPVEPNLQLVKVHRVQ